VSLLVAFVLGIVQGLFMFVPVSSTSHLVLTQTWMRDRGIAVPPPESPEMVLFDLVVHVGTLVSIVVVMHAGLRVLLAGVREDVTSGRLRAGGLRQAVATRLVALGLLTTAVTGVLGLAFRDRLTDVFGSPNAVAVALVLTGIMLWWTDRIGPGRIRASQVGVGAAVAVGIAQAAALAPGLSRSGTTIFVALLVGMLHLQCRTPQDDAGHDKQQKQQPDEQQGYTVARTRFGGTWKLMSWHMIGAVGSRIISYRCGRVPSMHRPICSRPQAVLPPRRP
jgi:undecaprenyl-diphosphatase